LQGVLRVGRGDNTISAGLEQNFSDGERTFIVVNAEDSALGFHKPR